LQLSFRCGIQVHAWALAAYYVWRNMGIMEIAGAQASHYGWLLLQSVQDCFTEQQAVPAADAAGGSHRT
jgi:hypothetical protein